MENLQKEYERIEKCAMKPEIGRYDMSQDEMLAIAKCSPNIFKTIFIVEYKGEKMCLTDAAEKSSISHDTICGRYHRGDRGERLFRPVRNKK